MSVPAVPSPKVRDVPSSLVIGPPSAVVPSCVCPVDAAKAANIPMILLEDGYTDKKIEQIYHNHLISDFVNVEKIVSKYLHV